MSISGKLLVLALAIGVALAAFAILIQDPSEGAADAPSASGTAPQTGTSLRGALQAPDPASSVPGSARSGSVRNPVPTKPERDPLLQVQVREASGLPSADVKVYAHETAADKYELLPIWMRSEPPPFVVSAVTDQDGVATFFELPGAPEALEGVLVVDAKGGALWTRLEPLASRVELTWPKRGRLAGTVTVDGRQPPHGLQLTLTGFEDPASLWSETARALLRRFQIQTDRCTVVTGPDGRFQFGRVPAESPLELAVSGPFVDAEGRAARRSLVELTTTLRWNLSSARRVLIELAPRLEEFRGTDVNLEVEWLGFDSSRSIRGRLGETVVLARPDSKAVGLQLRATGLDGGTLGELRVDTLPSEEETPIRFVLPAASHPLRLTVLEPRGNPAEGASVYYEEQLRPCVDGSIEITVSEAGGSLWIIAPCFSTREVPPDELAGSALMVQLDACAALELEVRSPFDLSAHGVGVDVGAGWAGQQDPTPFLRPLSRELDADSRWRTCDLAPGEPVVLALRDSFGYELLRGEYSLSAGEVRQLIWSTLDAPRDLVGRVLDPDGRPIVGARIMLGGLLDRGTPVDEHGVFELRNVFDPAPRPSVVATGFVRRVLEPEEVLQAADHVLEPARSLLVVLDGLDGSAQVDRLVFRTDTREFFSARRAGSNYRFSEIPKVPGVVAIEAVGLSRSVAADTTELRWDLAN